MSSEIKVGLGDIFIVSDGMGGHNSGALAANLTVQGIAEHLRKTPPGLSAEEAIKQAFSDTNAAVYERGHTRDSEAQGMGATAVLLLLTDNATAYIAHAGDSRAYLYRRGHLQQLTTDHTLVQRMVMAGILTPAEAREHPDASVLERAVGHKPEIEVDIHPAFQLKKGDGILLCSDGLSGYVEDREIEAVIRSTDKVREIANCLVKLALNAGGYDNVAVQYIHYGKWSAAERKFDHIWYQIIANLLALAFLAGWYIIYYREPAESSSIRSL